MQLHSEVLGIRTSAYDFGGDQGHVHPQQEAIQEILILDAAF